MFHGSQEKLALCEQYQSGLVIPTEQIFQTTVISKQIFKKVFSQNLRLQTVIQQVRADHPALLEVVPSETVVEAMGEQTLFTMTFA